MAPDDAARGRLSVAMDRRRVELRLKWNQVAQRANMSIGHLHRIRNNEAPLSDLAKASLEAALELPRGAIDAILAQPDASSQSSPEFQPPTSPAEADEMGVAQILAILRTQQRELEELRTRDAKRQQEMAEISEELRRAKERNWDDKGDDRRKGA